MVDSGDPKTALLNGFDQAWSQFRRRLDGIDDDEYLWAPVDDPWTVRPAGSGQLGVVDGAADREADPAPVTTIAWRLWHVAVDCLDSYSQRLLNETGSSVSGPLWHLDSKSAVVDLDKAWRCFRDGIGHIPSGDLWNPLGDSWGPYSRSSIYDLGIHALREVTHHGAEVALLRDLYRSGASAS